MQNLLKWAKIRKYQGIKLTYLKMAREQSPVSVTSALKRQRGRTELRLAPATQEALNFPEVHKAPS